MKVVWRHFFHAGLAAAIALILPTEVSESSDSGYILDFSTSGNLPGSDGHKTWQTRVEFSARTMRIESDRQTVIVDLDEKALWILFARSKQGYQISFQELENYGKESAATDRQIMVRQMLLQAMPSEEKWTPTEVNSTIGAFQAKKYIFEMGHVVTAILWLSQEFDLPGQFFAMQRHYYETLPWIGPILSRINDHLERLAAIPVDMAMQIDLLGQQIEFRSRLLSLRTEEIAAERFAIPDDYQISIGLPR